MATYEESPEIVRRLMQRYVDPSSSWRDPYELSPPRFTHASFLRINDATWSMVRSEEGDLSRHQNAQQVGNREDWHLPVSGDFRSVDLPYNAVYAMTPGNIQHLFKQYCSPSIAQMLTSPEALANIMQRDRLPEQQPDDTNDTSVDGSVSDDAVVPERLVVEVERVQVVVHDDEGHPDMLPLYGGPLETSLELRLSADRTNRSYGDDLSSDLSVDRPMKRRKQHESFFERWVETRMAFSRNHSSDAELDAMLEKAESVLRKCKYPRRSAPQSLNRQTRHYTGPHSSRYETSDSYSSSLTSTALCRATPRKPVTYENSWCFESRYDLPPTQYYAYEEDWDSDDSSLDFQPRARPNYEPSSEVLEELYDSPYKLRRMHYEQDYSYSRSSEYRPGSDIMLSRSYEYGSHNSDKTRRHLYSDLVDQNENRRLVSRFLGDRARHLPDVSQIDSYDDYSSARYTRNRYIDDGDSGSWYGDDRIGARGHAAKSVRFADGSVRYFDDDASDYEYGDEEDGEDDSPTMPIKKFPTIVQPNRWVGCGFLSDPVEFHTDRGYLLWVCPRGKLRVHFYYGHNGDDFTCFVDPQFGGVSMYHVIRETPRLIVGGREDARRSRSPYHVRRSPCRHAYENWFRILSKRGIVTLELKAIRGFPTSYRAFKINFTIVPR